MTTYTNSTESNKDSTTLAVSSFTGYEAPAVTPPAEVETHDDLGYEIEPAIPVEPEKPVVTPHVVDEKPVEKLVSGYGEDKDEPKKPDEVPPPTEEVKEIAEIVKDLGEGYDKDKITKFAVENKFTKEQLSAYVKLIKDEDAAIKTSQEEAKLARRESWQEELTKDPEFGGENIANNFLKVEKLLEKMPNTKKMLTETKGMLPPYIMKDFLKLAKELNPVAPLVVGEPAGPKEDSSNFLDDLYS